MEVDIVTTDQAPSLINDRGEGHAKGNIVDFYVAPGEFGGSIANGADCIVE
jgi:hypothetical protein